MCRILPARFSVLQNPLIYGLCHSWRVVIFDRPHCSYQPMISRHEHTSRQMNRLIRNPLVSDRCLARGKKRKVGSREHLPDDLGEFENIVVKKEAALHWLTRLLFAMARYVDPIAVSHRSKNSFYCSLLVLQADHIDTI